MQYIVKKYIFLYNYAVAPLVGAWIEIPKGTRVYPHDERSLPLWERGLKYF